MMKKSIALSALSLTLCISSLTADPVPDMALLTAGTFAYPYGLPDYSVAAELQFKKDKTFALYYAAPGYTSYNTGSFSIEGGQVRLRPVKCYTDRGGSPMDCKEGAGEFTCRISENAESLHYSRFLSCDAKKAETAAGIDFPAHGSKVKSGEKRRIQGIGVVTMGAREGVTTASVKIRKSPSTDAEAVTFVDFEVQASLPSVPANSRVIVLARTEAKEKVGKWNNYWLCVDVGMNRGVWMYGEFVSLKGN
jgi:hypothetical protein